MSRYAVAYLDEIDEVSDGHYPSRPVRYHFGITSFGVNAWTGREAGDRIIKEHNEAEDEDGQEELYLVQRGRARFELDGERIEAPVEHVGLRPARRQTHGVRRGAGNDDHCPRRHAGEGVRAHWHRDSGRRSSRSTRQPSTPRPLIEGTT